jgi:hypothetical protein
VVRDCAGYDFWWGGEYFDCGYVDVFVSGFAEVEERCWAGCGGEGYGRRLTAVRFPTSRQKRARYGAPTLVVGKDLMFDFGQGVAVADNGS